MAHALPELIDYADHIGCGHPGALAMSNVDKPHALQILHRLSDRRSTDLVSHHQVTFRWQGVARRQTFFSDKSKQPVLHIIRKFALFDRVNFWVGDHTSSMGE